MHKPIVLSHVYFLFLHRCVQQHCSPCYQGDTFSHHQPLSLATPQQTTPSTWSDRPPAYATPSEEAEAVKQTQESSRECGYGHQKIVASFRPMLPFTAVLFDLIWFLPFLSPTDALCSHEV